MMRFSFLLLVFCVPSVLWAQGAPTEAAAAIGGERCGDGIVEGKEQCDDGNLNGDDGCTTYCYISSPKDPLIGAAVALGGALFVPVVGGSVGYLYAGEREQFKRMALLRAAFGTALAVGVVGLQVSVVVGFNGGNADAFVPVAIGLLAVGAVGREAVDISCIIGAHAAIEQYNERIRLYQEAKPHQTSYRLKLDLGDLAVAPMIVPTAQGSTIGGGMIGLHF